MTDPTAGPRPEDQIAAVGRRDGSGRRPASPHGVEVVLTHGNGPQVGNLLVKNELAAAVVPPVPLDWCGAQTQATHRLPAHGRARPSPRRARRRPPYGATVVTRTLVDGDDPGFTQPTKPIGRYLPADEAAVLVEHGETWEDRGARGWRRVVASPEPLEILDAPAIAAAGRRGVRRRRCRRRRHPRRARRRTARCAASRRSSTRTSAAALLARSVDADVLVIATDVEHVVLDYGTAAGRGRSGGSTPAELRAYAAEGHFASGSMGPKVEAAVPVRRAGRDRAP